MSYNFYLRIQTGPQNTVDVYERNYTANVSGMWEKALGFSIMQLNGMQAKDIIAYLGTAITNMTEKPGEYKAMNPPNKWGRYEGALDVLDELQTQCIEHPYCILHISH